MPSAAATDRRTTWGRNLVDHLIRLLPDILTAQIVDFDTFGFGPVFQENLEQIRRVEQLSDAYHLKLGRQDVMVAYLLEITR